MNFLTNKYARALTAVLLLQIFAFYALARRSENVPVVGPLSRFPANLGSWSAFRDFPTDAETQEVLKADDILSRQYVDTTRARNCTEENRWSCLVLFVAFFKTQQYGQAPHSPKNC